MTKPEFAPRLKRLLPQSLFGAVGPAYHFLLAFLGALLYALPSRHLTIIGVTGTNGKTTVVHLLHEIFRAAGHGVASVSSLRFRVNEAEEENRLKMTMPGRLRLQKFLRAARGAGCRFVILEVTSEGIRQFRHRFIRFQAAVLTNLTPEHIESHGSFENYRAAKLELFQRLRPSAFAILNRESESGALFQEATPAAVVWYSRSAIQYKDARYPVRVVSADSRRVQLMLGSTLVEARLGGMFNAMNVLAACAAALAFNVSPSVIAQPLRRIRGVPGRLEYIQEKPFAAVVDYAHTPDALEQVYQALQSAGGLICVFGAAGGGRDRWKRPEMGKIAERYCKRIILTAEDPDDEDPQRIMAEIESGISKFRFPIPKVIDRQEAMRTALRQARPGDTVVITGMGAQPWFIEKGEKIRWDERAIVREELQRISQAKFD